MISCGFLTKHMVIALENCSNVEKYLEMLLEMKDYSQTNSTKYKKDDTVYLHPYKGEDFSSWLYNYSVQPELHDLKLELSKFIERSSIETGKINFDSLNEEEFIVGNNTKGYVWSINDFHKFKRNRLSNSLNTNELFSNLSECFPNIFFDETVKKSLSTLSTPFYDIRNDIVFHLSKLDEFHNEFRLLLAEGTDFKNISVKFTEFSGIDCSPQAGREGVEKLKRKFYNNQTNAYELLTCELHTKFKDKNRGQRRPERIYFHPGHKGIQDEKILVIYIGAHL